MNEQVLIQNFTFVLIQASLSFILAIALTPIYTYFAFKYKWWKQIRTTTTTGEKAKVFAALHAAKHKRNIPTMAGIIMVIAISIVTLLLNLSRSQTYLPLFGLVAAGAIGLLDDFINIRGNGKGVAGLRSIIKFSLILLIAVVGALYFYFRLGYSILHIPAVGSFEIGILLTIIFSGCFR